MPLVKKYIFILFVLFYLTPSALADGFIIIDPPQIPRPFPVLNLSVTEHKVTIDIENQVAQVHIFQTFKNNNNFDVEGTYLFPIPEQAALSDFRLKLNGTVLESKPLDKDEAQRIYEEKVRQMIDPALLEYVGRGLYQARVYPIAANSEIVLEIDYTEVLAKDNDTIRLLYPLSTEKFSAEKLQLVDIAVNIKTKEAIKNVYSPTHNVKVTTIGTKEANVHYRENDVKPDRDFELLYSESTQEFTTNVISYKADDEDGFFLLLTSPNLEINAQDIGPKDLIFVLDTSGSMSGEKMEQAKDALLYCLDQLASQNRSNQKDRFSIVDFSDSVNKFHASLQNATDQNIAAAKEYVNSMEANGGTNIHDALKTALEMMQDGSQNKMLVFLTDGEPTVGITGESDIINAVKKNNNMGSKIFVFGVGSDVNTHLLDFISGDSKAVSSYVSEEEDIEVKVSAFFDKISFPVLSNLAINFGENIGVYDLFPKVLPDLYKGSQLVLLGRYKNSGSSSITLSGQSKDENISLRFENTFPSQKTTYGYIPTLWASRKVGYLMDQIRLQGDSSNELRQSIITLSKKYGIINEYTSFLIDSDIPLGTPNYLKDAESALDDNFINQGFENKTGGEAQKAVQNVQQLQQSENIAQSQYFLNNEQQAKIKQAGDKVFYEQNSVWIDSEYSGQETLKLSFFSYEDYFELLNQHPEFGPYLALGQQVIFCSGDICYQIMPDVNLWESYQIRNFNDLVLDPNSDTFHWATGYIQALVFQNIIEGYNDNSFRPDQTITRAEFIKIAKRTLGSPPQQPGITIEFTDVSAQDWFYGDLSDAIDMGIITGYPDNSFRPNNPITRAEAIKVTLLVAQTMENYGHYDFPEIVSQTSYDFPDIVNHWAKDYIQTAKNLGLVEGYADGDFHPNNNLTRAEASKIIMETARK